MKTFLGCMIRAAAFFLLAIAGMAMAAPVNPPSISPANSVPPSAGSYVPDGENRRNTAAENGAAIRTDEIKSDNSGRDASSVPPAKSARQHTEDIVDVRNDLIEASEKAADVLESGKDAKKALKILAPTFSAGVAVADAAACTNAAPSDQVRLCGHAAASVLDAARVPGASMIAGFTSAHAPLSQGDYAKAAQNFVKDGRPIGTACGAAGATAGVLIGETVGALCGAALGGPVGAVVGLKIGGAVGGVVGGVAGQYLGSKGDEVLAESIKDNEDDFNDEVMKIRNQFDLTKQRNQEMAELRRQESEQVVEVAPSGESNFLQDFTAAMLVYDEMRAKHHAPLPAATGPCHPGHDEAAHPGGCRDGMSTE